MARGAHTRKPVITPQQKRAVELFKQNMLSGGTKTILEILLEAGYSESSANQQTHVMAGIRPHLQPFLQEMEEHRTEVLALMRKRFKRADYGALVRGFDILTHNLQLLAGKPTHNIALSGDRRAELEALIET
jgi:triphosphoribosyl-dephospho-CoA synthetase